MFLFMLLILFLVYNYMVAKLYFWVTEGASELPLDGLVGFIGGASILILLLLVFMMVVIGLLLIVYKFCSFVVFMFSHINFSKFRALCLCIHKRVVVYYNSVSNFFGYFYSSLKFFYKNERSLLSIIAMLKLLAKGVIDYPVWVVGHIFNKFKVVKSFIMSHYIFFSLIAVAVIASVSTYFILSGQYQAHLLQWEVFYKAQILIQDINNTAYLESQREQLAVHLESLRRTNLFADSGSAVLNILYNFFISKNPVAIASEVGKFLYKHPPVGGV